MAADFQHLVIGARYAVIKAFTDYDGAVHPVGEAWTYEGHNFLPYEDGLTLRIAPGESIRLQWRRETQAAIIDALADYIATA